MPTRTDRSMVTNEDQPVPQLDYDINPFSVLEASEEGPRTERYELNNLPFGIEYDKFLYIESYREWLFDMCNQYRLIYVNVYQALLEKRESMRERGLLCDNNEPKSAKVDDTKEYVCLCGETVTGKDVYKASLTTIEKKALPKDSKATCICRSCHEEEMYACELCGDNYHESMHKLVNVDGKKLYLCPGCIVKIVICESCGGQTTKPHGFEEGGKVKKLCAACIEAMKPIKGHTYRPATKFFGLGTPHLGVELEVENSKELKYYERSSDNVKKDFNPTHDIADWVQLQIDSLFYCKRDGSIGRGGEAAIEIVSHPFTFDFAKKHKKQIATFLKELKEQGCHGNPKTCGMHVHVSRKDLSTTNIYKMLRFFKQNEDFIKFISGRDNISQMEQYASVKNSFASKLSITKSALSGRSATRYSAINLTNTATVEIRIFQSTLDPKAYYKNLEFVIALYSFSKEGSLTASYNDFQMYVEKAGMYNNLLEYMGVYAQKAKAKTINLDIAEQFITEGEIVFDEYGAHMESLVSRQHSEGNTI